MGKVSTSLYSVKVKTKRLRLFRHLMDIRNVNDWNLYYRYFVHINAHGKNIFTFPFYNLQSWPKYMAKTAKNGVVLDTTNSVQPI